MATRQGVTFIQLDGGYSAAAQAVRRRRGCRRSRSGTWSLWA